MSYYKLRLVDQVGLQGKKVLLRVDFNLPLDKQTGEITDETRLVTAIPTIEYILSQGGGVMLLSHLGRPETKADRRFYSFEKMIPRLKELLPSSNQVSLVKDILNPPELKPSNVFLGENIRFFPEETSDQPSERDNFAKKLCSGFDIYVNDAFSASHRDHASITSAPKLLPGYAGFLFQKEVEVLTSLQQNIQRPYVAIVGGSKISTKIAVLKSLIKKVDSLLIGGAMTYTFLKSRAVEIGSSSFERNFLAEAFKTIDEANYHKKELLLPIDHIVAKQIDSQASTKVSKHSVPNGFMGVDIGPRTLKKYVSVIKSAKTIFWNGPVGVFEIPNFSKGTIKLAKAVGKSKATSIIGGGDSISAMNLAEVQDQITHVSTGGGATLKFLEGSTLPGVSSLKRDE